MGIEHIVLDTNRFAHGSEWRVRSLGAMSAAIGVNPALHRRALLIDDVIDGGIERYACPKIPSAAVLSPEAGSQRMIRFQSDCNPGFPNKPEHGPAEHRAGKQHGRD